MTNTLTSIRATTPAFDREAIENKVLLKMINDKVEYNVLQTLGMKQSVARNQGTNKVMWKMVKPLPVAANRHVIVEGTNPAGMKVGYSTVEGSISTYGAYVEVTRQNETYNLQKVLEDYTSILAEHAAATFELIVRDAIEEDAGVAYVVASNITSPTVNSVATGNVLSLVALRKATSVMKANRRSGMKAAGKNYTVLTAVEGMEDLIDDDDLENKFLVPGNTNKPIVNGTLEGVDIYNMRVRVYEYPVIEENTQSVLVYHTYIIAENAYAVMKLEGAGVEMKKMDFGAKIGDNLGQKASLGWIAMGFGAKVLDELAITILHHAVSNPITREDFYASQTEGSV